MRAKGGFYDVSHHAKFEIKGKQASAFLDLLTTRKLPEIGKCAIAPMLKQSGYIQALFSIARLAQDHYWLIGTGNQNHVNHSYFENIAQNYTKKYNVEIRNHTQKYAGIAVAGKQGQRHYLPKFAGINCRALACRRLKLMGSMRL